MISYTYYIVAVKLFTEGENMGIDIKKFFEVVNPNHISVKEMREIQELLRHLTIIEHRS